jgi:hypothetical protein
VFTDPLAVTYDSIALSLPRVGAGKKGTMYRTADALYSLRFSENELQSKAKQGQRLISVELNRTLPDPTPSNVFDDYRTIRNGFGCFYITDASRAEMTDNIPKLRTALLAFLTPAIEARVLAGEK